MSSNFSKKLKAKKTSDTDIKNIREELKNVPDNGILEDIKAPYEAVNKREEENTSDTIKNKPDDITENQSESIINDKIEAADIAAPVESLSENISESAASDKTDTEENRPDKTVSYDKAPYPDMPYTSSESGSMFWNCRLSQDLVDKLEYNIFIHDSSIKEFMNTIIMEEKHFYDRYSSMITTDIIKKNKDFNRLEMVGTLGENKFNGKVTPQVDFVSQKVWEEDEIRTSLAETLRAKAKELSA